MAFSDVGKPHSTGNNASFEKALSEEGVCGCSTAAVSK